MTALSPSGRVAPVSDLWHLLHVVFPPPPVPEVDVELVLLVDAGAAGVLGAVELAVLEVLAGVLLLADDAGAGVLPPSFFEEA